MSNDSEYRLPDTGRVYDPQKRARRRDFERRLGTNMGYRNIMEWFLGCGQFAPAEDGTPHPAVMPPGSNQFLDSVRNGYLEWGTVTDRQLEAIGKFYRNVDAVTLNARNVGGRAKSRKAATPGAVMGSYVGQPGERLRLTLSVHKAMFAKKTGEYTTLLYTPEQDLLVYFTPVKLTEGSSLEARVTVKAHQEHKGRAQTLLETLEIVNTRTPRRIGNATSNHD